jgi:hypothetical protein
MPSLIRSGALLAGGLFGTTAFSIDIILNSGENEQEAIPVSALPKKH